MQITQRHSFDLTEQEQRQIQRELRKELVIPSTISTPKIVAGIDLAYFDDQAVAVVLAMDYETKEILEIVSHQATVYQQYVPGLLAFRELPVILPAWEKLQTEPDIVFFDGNGILHPDRMGLATHASFFLDKPTVGIAKTYFLGEYQMPASKRGSYEWIWDNEEIVGAIVRTQTGVKPVYISIGNRINLTSAIQFSLHLVGKESRIPEITRQADIWTRKLRKQKSAVIGT